MYAVGFELKLKCTTQSGINMANDKHELYNLSPSLYYRWSQFQKILPKM